MLKHTWFLVSAIFLLASVSLLVTGCSPLSKHATPPPSGWVKLDAGTFSIYGPPGWEFHKGQGIDSYVGSFSSEGVVLRFDFGRYSNPLDQYHEPAYVVAHEAISGYQAKIVSPRIPGQGTTGVYFKRAGGSNRLCLWGDDLEETQQQIALKMFRTIQFK